MSLLNNKTIRKYDIIGGEKNYQIKKRCFGVKFDPDSSPDTWIIFLKRYPKILNAGLVEVSPEGELYRFKPKENWDTSGNRNKNFRIRYKYNFDSSDSIRIAGDCDFNFRKNNFTKFEMIIKQSNLCMGDKLRMLNKLYFCNMLHHTYLNFSIFPVSYKLQFLKGRSDDRLDLFLVDLKKFYSKEQKQSQIYKHSSKEIQMYFNSFENFENYLYIIYHIDVNVHKEFVDELLSLPKVIVNTDNLERYFDIVLMHWELRMEHFETLRIV